MVRKVHADRNIESFERGELRRRVVELARERFKDQVVDALEIEHLVDVATNYSLLLSDIYDPKKVEQILYRGDPGRARWLSHLDVAREEPRSETILRLRQVPDQIKTVADKCLYDVGVFRRDRYRGVDLTDLGVRSYRMASQILEILAEDRRLRDFFRSNTLGNLPIEDEIVFLGQCAQRFSIHAELLNQLRLLNQTEPLAAPAREAGAAPREAGAGPAPAARRGASGPASGPERAEMSARGAGGSGRAAEAGRRGADGESGAVIPISEGPAAGAEDRSSGAAIRSSAKDAAPADPAASALAPIRPAALEPVREPRVRPRRDDERASRRHANDERAAPGDASLVAPEPGSSPIQHDRLSALERMLLFSALPIEALRARLKEIVIDQDDAVDTLCDEFTLYATGTESPRRPSSYLFVGPTGVGKNYLVETLVMLLQEHWGEEVPFLLLEGPNYTYPSDISELRGATRGFIRSDEEGVLTEFHHRSSRAPFAIILVDEVEKSHPQLQRFFLSVMDRGTVTDNRGQTLRFGNTMIVFTSNLGYSRLQQQAAPIGYGNSRGPRRYPRKEIERELKKTLSPEFLNRLLTVHFAPLSRESIARIFDLELDKIASLYERIHGLRLDVTGRAKEALIERGYSDDYGARFLATTLQRHCNIEVSKKLKREEHDAGRHVRPVLDYLREVRAGQRLYREHEAERLVHDQARVRVSYRRLRIDFRDGEFLYEPGKSVK